MKEERVLAAACVHVDCTLDQVMAYHVYDDRITLVVNRGIAGGPKYTVALAELAEQEPESPTAEDIALAEADIDATPSARRLAQEHDVDLAFVAGSGEDGRILKRDVSSYVRLRKVASPAKRKPSERTVGFYVEPI